MILQYHRLNKYAGANSVKLAQEKIAVVTEAINPTLELVESAKDGMLKSHTSISTCLLIIQMPTLSQTCAETLILGMDRLFGAILMILTKDGIGVTQWISLCQIKMLISS